MKVKKKLDLGGVLDDGETLHENMTRVEKEMSKKESINVSKALKKHFFFNNLMDEDIKVLISKMFLAKVNDGEFLFQQKDRGSCFFIINSGKIKVLIDGDCKKELGENDSFGELALMYDAPRSASIKCVGDCTFWVSYFF